MADKGRGSAAVPFALAVIVLLVLSSEWAAAEAKVYTVGDKGGWSFNVAGWPKGKRFRAGDVLVFNYPRVIHNVVAVNKGGYQTCNTPRGAKVYQSGSDRIKLSRGQNFFICNIPGHCQGGMKIAVTAT